MAEARLLCSQLSRDGKSADELDGCCADEAVDADAPALPGEGGVEYEYEGRRRSGKLSPPSREKSADSLTPAGKLVALDTSLSEA